jgi:hypothetical protein
MADGSCAKSSMDKGVWFLVAFAIPCCTLHLEHKASMETKERFCDICAFQHINELAVEWCSECDEALCSKCKVQHGIAKATRNHTPLIKSCMVFKLKNLFPSFSLNFSVTKTNVSR